MQSCTNSEVKVVVHAVDAEYRGKANAIIELLGADGVNYLYEVEFTFSQFNKYKKRLRSRHVYIRTINDMRRNDVKFTRLEKSYTDIDNSKPVSTEEALKRVRKILEGLSKT